MTLFNPMARNHTVAAAKVDENFERLKGSLQPVVDSVNELKRRGTVKVGGMTIRLVFYLGGDLKVHLYSYSILVYCCSIVLAHVNGAESCKLVVCMPVVYCSPR